MWELQSKCQDWACSVSSVDKESQPKLSVVQSVSHVEWVEISETWQKLIEFFRRFRNNPDKIAVFQGSLLDANNIWLKAEFDKVYPVILQESMDDPTSNLSQSVNELKKLKSLEPQKRTEVDLDLLAVKTMSIDSLKDASDMLWVEMPSSDEFYTPVIVDFIKTAFSEEFNSVRAKLKSLEETKEAEFCALCWWTRATCSWYAKNGNNWPYFVKFRLNQDWTISKV